MANPLAGEQMASSARWGAPAPLVIHSLVSRCPQVHRDLVVFEHRGTKGVTPLAPLALQRSGAIRVPHSVSCRDAALPR